MSFVHRPDLTFVQGAPDLLDPVYLGMPVVGKVFYLDPTSGHDGNSGLAHDDAFATLPTAYAALRDGFNDVLYYIPGSGSISLDEAFVWSKSYAHFIGLCAPTPVGQRCRIFQTSTATGVSPLMTFSGTSCIVSNIYVFQGVADATSLINVSVSGQRCLFNNVHFAGGGNALHAIDDGMALKVDGGAENLFVNCTIGVDTAEASDGYAALVFDGSARRNTFDNCMVVAYPKAGATGVALVELADTSACDRWNVFKRTRFFSNSTNKAVTLASAFVIPSGHTTTATIFLDWQSRGLGFTDWDANNRGILYLDAGTAVAGGNAGFSLVSTSA